MELLVRTRHLEHWLGRIVLGRHVTLELRTRVLSTGSVARDSRRQCGWIVVSVRVRRRRNTRSLLCHEQRCTHFHGGLGIEDITRSWVLPFQSGKSVQKGVKRKKAKARTRARKEERQKKGASQMDHHVASSVTRPGELGGWRESVLGRSVPQKGGYVVQKSHSNRFGSRLQRTDCCVSWNWTDPVPLGSRCQRSLDRVLPTVPHLPITDG